MLLTVTGRIVALICDENAGCAPVSSLEWSSAMHRRRFIQTDNAEVGAREMKRLEVQLERLRTEAADCDILAYTTIDARKRELFERLAGDLRRLAADIETVLEARKLM
jgi:hypothetical protein